MSEHLTADSSRVSGGELRQLELRAALCAAEKSLSAVAGLLEAYPRPSNDPNGRLLLNAREHAKHAALAARETLARIKA